MRLRFCWVGLSVLNLSRARYLDGQLVPLKPGASADPQPCAGNDGTVITVSALFKSLFYPVQADRPHFLFLFFARRLKTCSTTYLNVGKRYKALMRNTRKLSMLSPNTQFITKEWRYLVERSVTDTGLSCRRSCFWRESGDRRVQQTPISIPLQPLLPLKRLVDYNLSSWRKSCFGWISKIKTSIIKLMDTFRERILR